MKKLLCLFLILGAMVCTLAACGTSYTVTFNVNGEEYATVSVGEGKTVTLPEAPKVEGYVFAYWMLDGKEWDTETPILGDITLEAKLIDEKIYAFDGNFEFALSDDGAYYTLIGIGGFEENAAVIPETYNGLPVTAIGKDALRGTHITSVTVPASITEIGEGAFGECASLKEIKVAEGNTSFKADNGCLYTENGKILLAYAIARGDKEIAVPKGVTVIGAYTFSRAANVEKIILPDSLSVISEYALYGCENLREAVISNNSSLMVIGKSAFSSSKRLESIMIPNGVIEISSFAFYGCTGLKEISFGKNPRLSTVADYAFSNCTQLTDLNYDGTISKFKTFVTVGEGNDALLNAENKSNNVGSYTYPAGAWVPTEEYAGITYATWKTEEDFLLGKPPVTWFTDKKIESKNVGSLDTMGDTYLDYDNIPGYVHIFANVEITEKQISFGQTQKVVVNLGGFELFLQQGFRVGGTDGSRKEASALIKNGSMRHQSGQIQPRADCTFVFENVLFTSNIGGDFFYGPGGAYTVFRNCEIHLCNGASFMLCGRWDFEEGERNVMRFENTDIICTAGATPTEAFFRIYENGTYESLWDIVFDGDSAIYGNLGTIALLKEARTGKEVHPFSTVQSLTFLDGFIFSGGATPYSTYKFIEQDGENEVAKPVVVREANDGLFNIYYGNIFVLGTEETE